MEIPINRLMHTALAAQENKPEKSFVQKARKVS
jgi:hypothetical protein